MAQIKILYYPQFNGENYYVKINEECLKDAGFSVNILSKNVFKLLFEKSTFVYLQWFENLPLSKNEIFKMMFLKMCMYYVFKLKSTKIIYVMHNKVSHEKEIGKYSHFMLKFILKRAYKIIILSDTTIDEIKKIVGVSFFNLNNINKRIFKIPHPNFIGVYPQSKVMNFAELKSATEGKFTIMSMGMIRPYKNIDIIIKAFKKSNIKEAQLVIVGKPQPTEYGDCIKQLTEENDNIHLVYEFIRDEDMDEIVSLADIMVFPYNKRSCLNSGAIYLAFSYAKTIVSPPIGTVNEFKDFSNCMYIYDYYDEKDHIKHLSNQFEVAYNDWNNNKNEFYAKGKSLYEVVKERNSRQVLIETYQKNINIFDHILKT